MVRGKQKTTKAAQHKLQTNSSSNNKGPRGLKNSNSKSGSQLMSKVNQSVSDSTIVVNKSLAKQHGTLGPTLEQSTVPCNFQEKPAKPRVTQSETLTTSNNVTNKTFRTHNGPKISTNSTRLIQQFPQKFCFEPSDSCKDLGVNKQGPPVGNKPIADEVGLNVNIASVTKSICDNSISTDKLFCIPSKVRVQESKSEMLAPELKKPMSLMEQKKQQWAREKELNGLWSPWGRPMPNPNLPINSQNYMNKLQNSSLQSECHLPPILTNMSPMQQQQQQQQQQQKFMWNCEVDKEALGERVSRKSSLPICINATTGEVHYNHSQGGGRQQTDMFQVNNAVTISSNNNLHNALNISAVKYDSHSSKTVESKKTTHGQQQSAHSVTSTTNGGWSSMDEEAFTSGYHSEVNGCLSNEEFSGMSRNGSGDGPNIGEIPKGKSGGQRGQNQGKNDQGGPHVIVHNITEERRSYIQGPDELKHYTMRSSITVGLDTAVSHTDSYQEIQKLEKKKWLSELEKQREEQRIRKQMEKDEKRPKWGDKGIGVGHFWEPSQSNDHLPQPSRDDTNLATTPAWLEKGLSRMQSSVSQPSLYDNGSSQTNSEFQGATNLFSNQSTIDLRNVVGLGDLTQNERNYLRGQNVPTDPDMNAEKERKRIAAIEHQEAIRKQIEERQQRLKEEKERRLKEELEDEEKAKFMRLRELELIELEARKMRFYNNCHTSEEGEDPKYQYDMSETKDIRKILKTDTEEPDHNEKKQEESKEQEGRRVSPTSEVIPEPVNNQPIDSMPATNYLTTSQSMVNISHSHQSSYKDQEQSLPQTPFGDSVITPEPERNCSSTRSRSLSNQREFGTQTDLESKADAKNNQKNRSHNCLVKGSKSKGSTGEDSETKKVPEKPRWGVAQSKKQYVKQSEKDPLYQHRLKRRMDRIKKIEDRLHGVNGVGIGGGGGDTGTESEEMPSTRSRGRSPPGRFRNRHFNNNNATVHRAPSESTISPRKHVPMKATAKIQERHHSPVESLPRENFSNRHSSRTRKIFPDIPGRTIGPLNTSTNDHFDPFGLNRQRSSENSSRFSSPSLESVNSKNVETHYFKQHVGSTGDSVEVDLESRFVSSTSRSVEIRYEESRNSRLMSPQTKTVIETESICSNDEVTYRKTVFGNSKTIQSEPEIRSQKRHHQPENFSSSDSTHNTYPLNNNNNNRETSQFQLNNQRGEASQFQSNNIRETSQFQSNNNRETSQFQSNNNFETSQFQSNNNRDASQFQLNNNNRSKTSTQIPAQRTPNSQNKSRNSDKPGRQHDKMEKRGKKSRNKASPLKSTNVDVQNIISPTKTPVTIPTRMGSPPVPALLKKLLAGIPVEDIPVCEDFLYEIPRAQTAGSTSNGYKSVESDSSTHHPPLRSRVSSDGGLEIDIDPNYELAGIQLTSHSPHHDEDDAEEKPDELEGYEDKEYAFDGEKDSFIDEKYYFRHDKEEFDEDEKVKDHDDDDDDDEESEKDDVETEETKLFEPYEEDEGDEDEQKEELYREPLYPYPMENINAMSPPPALQVLKSDSPVRARVSSGTTTLEVMADYRKFNLPDYDYDSVKLFPHVDVGGVDMTAAVHNIRRPGTQDTDLSKREKLISYVINNKEVQAQISARDSELSQKGIIEFNVRLPSSSDEVYGSYSDYKDPLLSERQRATIRWLYSSDSSSNSKDSILTHLSYLKKGIQQQQQEWNVVPSDTEETTYDEYESLSHNYLGGSTNDSSSEDSKFSARS
ncbi:unnamed protein product [Allacma fusca]|uniref:CCDC66 domain-containing protein n=1 Tax=Allacma fusca TaxID=39272 RepID=A0A8J2M8Z8_9HEXA|nr:unnamed protein product [Allacma fusca]